MSALALILALKLTGCRKLTLALIVLSLSVSEYHILIIQCNICYRIIYYAFAHQHPISGSLKV